LLLRFGVARIMLICPYDVNRFLGFFWCEMFDWLVTSQQLLAWTINVRVLACFYRKWL